MKANRFRLQRGYWCQWVCSSHRIDVKIADIDPSTDVGDVEEAVRGSLDQGSELELKVSLTNDPYEIK